MITVEVPPGRDEERRYVIALVLGERLGIDYRLSRGRPGELRLSGGTCALSMPDRLFATPDDRWLTPASLPPTPLARATLAGGSEALAETDLPILYGEGEPGEASPAFKARDGEGRLVIDVFGSVFWLLTRYEEAAAPVADAHSRYPGSASLAHREGYLGRPLADEYIELLWKAMAGLWPRLSRRKPVPRLVLTHDVDFGRFSQTASWRVAARSAAADVVKRREPGLAVARASSYLAARLGRELPGDPFDTFDFLMGVSERHGRRSTFYFMAARASPAIDATYDLGDRWVAATLRRIGSRGHDVGLHGSYASYRDSTQLRHELDRLRRHAAEAGIRQPTWGGRQHYLRWHNPESWRAAEAAGIEHDSTLGFADVAGFRAGTSHDFPVFDLTARRVLRLRERPLLAMDVTFVRYLRADAAATRERITTLCRRAAAVGGQPVLPWHNNNVGTSAQRRFYMELVSELVRIVG